MKQPQMRMNKRQSVTIKEVAERAGVSLMTVSRVLNKQSVVREETRNRVEEAMRELNYRPNMLARGLAGGNSLFIGLVHANPSEGYLSQFLVGALNSCREAGHHLVLEDLAANGENITREEVERHLRGIGLDGIMLPPPLSENEEVIEALKNLEIPFVLIANSLMTDDLGIGINDIEAADRITQYLIDKGHRHIGFIIGATDQSSSHHRHQGYMNAMARNGLPVSEQDVAEGAFTYRSGMQAAAKILSQADRPTAIFASNDDMAAGVIATAHQKGLRVPQDLSVVGFDDTPIASAMWPQLTTIRQPIADMARRAVSTLALASQQGIDEVPERRQVLDIAVIERDTVAPPPAA